MPRHAFAANPVALRIKCAYSVPVPRVTHSPLSDPQVRRLQPRSTPMEVRDGHARGLILQVLPSGRKLWTMRYRHRGSQRRLVLGEYPTLSLAKARDACEDARAEIRNGGDPAGERQAAREVPTDTVAALVKEYVAKHVRGAMSARWLRLLSIAAAQSWRTGYWPSSAACSTTASATTGSTRTLHH